jgi:uncharacterized membrane protein YfhO
MVDSGGVNITNKTSAGYTAYENGSKQATMVYRYTMDRAGFLCFDLNMSARNSFTVSKNGNHLYSESLSLPQTLSVCQVVPGDVIELKITCKANESGSMTVRAATINDSVFQEGYRRLAASTLKLTKFTSTLVEGTILCDRDGLMYTSIPQNGDNWSVTVDGQEAEIVLVGKAMIAVELTEGQHEIQFTYRNKAFDLGWKVSLICLLIFLGITAFVYRPWEKFIQKRKCETQDE